MDGSKIEWTDATWNPLRGCSRVSEGCRNCYAEAVAARFSEPGLPYHGLAEYWFSDATKGGDGKFRPRWTGKVRFVEERLADPLRWKRPRRIFVNSMSDLFHESVPNDVIEAIFGVMAAAQQHTFQVLTKRPARMLNWFQGLAENAFEYSRPPADTCVIAAGVSMRRDEFLCPAVPWPLPNVWIGVSVEDQKTADERIPLLLETPAAVRWISAEPMLGKIDLAKAGGVWSDMSGRIVRGGSTYGRQLDWAVVGGESGPQARSFHLDWARALLEDCRAAGIPVFMKQIGARPCGLGAEELEREIPGVDWRNWPRHPKGGDMDEWPQHLRERDFPEAVSA